MSVCRCVYSHMQIDVLRERFYRQNSPIVIPQGNNLSNCSERKHTINFCKLGAIPLKSVVPDENILKVKCTVCGEKLWELCLLAFVKSF